MANNTFYSTEDIINRLQELKGKTKLKFYRSINIYYDEMNNRRQNNSFQFEEDPFSKNVQGIEKFYHEELLLVKSLQTKSIVTSINFDYYDLYYTVIKNKGENEIVDDKYENNEIDHINFNDFTTPHH